MCFVCFVLCGLLERAVTDVRPGMEELCVTILFF